MIKILIIICIQRIEKIRSLFALSPKDIIDPLPNKTYKTESIIITRTPSFARPPRVWQRYAARILVLIIPPLTLAHGLNQALK